MGNPSDGFFGKTLSVPVRNFHARVILFEWDRIEILPGRADHVNFRSLPDLIEDIEVNGYYGGYRLLKAAIRQFHAHVVESGGALPDRNFTIRYASDIPRQVGLAGSSAIITAAMKALCAFYGVEIPPEVLANRVLWAETKELGISAGLQDRVVQAFDRPVFMDFEREHLERVGHGRYEPVPAELFPPMYLAYRVKVTHRDVVHNDVRARWLGGDRRVAEVMEKLAENAAEGYEALRRGDLEEFEERVNANFDLRSEIYPISDFNRKMVELARRTGATAKFPGSGGAVLGTFRDDDHFEELEREFGKLGCRVVRARLN